MEVLSVGNPIPDRWRGSFSGPGGGVLNLNRFEFQVAIGFPGLSQQEIAGGQSGKIRLGILPYGDAIIILVEVGGVMVVDTSFDPRKVHPDDRGTPERESTEGLALSVFLFDTARDRTAALRMASVTPAFSDHIESFARDLYKRMDTDPDFDAQKSIMAAYRQYETPIEMFKDCVAVEYVGQAFPKRYASPTSRPT